MSCSTRPLEARKEQDLPPRSDWLVTWPDPRKGLLTFLCRGEVCLQGANAGKLVSSTMSEMAGEEERELELEREMVSVHRANLGGRGGGELAWGSCPPRLSLERDWQCFNISTSSRVLVGPDSLSSGAVVVTAPGLASY